MFFLRHYHSIESLYLSISLFFWRKCYKRYTKRYEDDDKLCCRLYFLMVAMFVFRYPCFENPYPMDIHESPVTACQYFADCQTDLIPALYSVGSSKQKRSGFSEKVWTITKVFFKYDVSLMFAKCTHCNSVLTSFVR